MEITTDFTQIRQGYVIGTWTIVRKQPGTMRTKLNKTYSSMQHIHRLLWQAQISIMHKIIYTSFVGFCEFCYNK